MNAAHLTMARKPPRPVLLTSFGAFPGVPDNVSDALVDGLSKTWFETHGAETPPPLTALLSVNWLSARPAIRALYAQHRPSIAIHFGVSHEATGLVIEKCAFNETEPQADASGQPPPQPYFCPEAPSTRATELNVDSLVQHLAAEGHPASVSTDPGRYLCNAVYYEALTCAVNAAEAVAPLFVHISDRLTIDTQPFTDTLAAAHALIGRLLCGLKSEHQMSKATAVNNER
jgi:pyroglutamyl-peptidase